MAVLWRIEVFNLRGKYVGSLIVSDDIHECVLTRLLRKSFVGMTVSREI